VEEANVQKIIDASLERQRQIMKEQLEERQRKGEIYGCESATSIERRQH
jgi:hypothetical protein